MRSILLPVLAVLIIGLSQGACQKRRKSEAKSDEPIGTAPASSEEGKGALQLRAEAIGLDEPHQYQVRLSWRVSQREPSVFFIIKRSDWTSGKVVQGDQSFFEDEEVKEGTNYSYQVQMLNGDRGPKTDWVEIQLPIDRVFENQTQILSGKISEYHRIFLKDRARVFWQGEELEIIADEIISEDGVFESFSPDLKEALPDELGKSGGSLKITARKLKGALYVKADGQKGGDGSVGITGTTGEKGGRGADTFLRWGDVTKMPEGAYLWRAYYALCDPKRPQGGIGGKGGKGGSGKPGQRGGNSGKVTLQFSELEEGDVFFTNQPGLGGAGGPGGLGGPGGEGGEPGSIEWQTYADDRVLGADFNAFHQCAPVKGDQGPQGEVGDPGPRGEDGFQTSFCLKLGNSEKGFCH